MRLNKTANQKNIKHESPSHLEMSLLHWIRLRPLFSWRVVDTYKVGGALVLFAKAIGN